MNIEIFKKMFLIRLVEESLLDLFSKGYLSGTVHTCIGQEACSVGVISQCDLNKDIFFSNHRGHGHYLSYYNNPKSLIAEIMGKEEGVCQGLGGSQHLQINNFYTNGIQGSGLPLIAGMSYAEKVKKSNSISVIFVGDGTFGEGSLYESLNIYSLWNLPVLVVVEDNKYAQTSPRDMQHAGNLSQRGDSFGIETVECDGMDVAEVSKISSALINSIRKNSKPKILYLNTYRFSPHSKGDDFRSDEEINTYKLRDPLINFKNQFSEYDYNKIENEIKLEVENIVNKLI